MSPYARLTPKFITTGAALLALSPAIAASAEDFTVVPGLRLGLARLGMTKVEARASMGNVDKTAVTEHGNTIEVSEWKEPRSKTFIIYIYDKKGKIAQIETNAPVPATAGGISIKSSISQVKAAYPSVCEFKGKDRTYLLDSKSGIAFGLQTDKSCGHELFDIVILSKGQKLLANQIR